MLIRSQDKKAIYIFENINKLGACKIYGKNEIDYAVEMNNSQIIGIYSNEPKAIKVLDMICSVYEYQERTKQIYVDGTGVVEQGYVGCEVFNIPTDEEVDEPTVQDIIDDLMKM